MIESRKGRKIDTFLVAIIGLSATMGEQMNSFFSSASRLFVIFCFTLVFIRVVLSFVPGHRGLWARYGCCFWILLFIVFAHISILMIYSNASFAFLDLIEKYRVPLFMVFAFTLTGVFVENPKNLTVFAYAYMVGFLIMIPFGKTGDYATAFRFYGTYANPNTYALDCIIAIFLCLFLLKDEKLRLIKIISLVVCSVCLIQTGSRGALMSTLIGCAIVFLFTKGFKRKLVIVLAALIGVVAVIIYSFQDTQGIISRLFESSYSGNIRLSIWDSYLHNISRFFWFGMDEQQIYSICEWTPHNSYLGVLVRYGVFAFVPFVIFVVMTLVKAFMTGKNTNDYGTRVTSGVVISLVISGMTMENINLRSAWIIYAITLACINGIVLQKNDIMMR